MNTFTIPRRQESPKVWDENVLLNLMIERMLQTSIKDFLRNPEPVPTSIPAEDNVRVWNSPENEKIPYSTSTLGESGCAVYAFHQGLRLRERDCNISIESLAAELGAKGYYEPGQGTYHNCFDHFGLRRASHVEEIFATLDAKESPMITLLVRNAKYPGTDAYSGSHFVNIIGSGREGEEDVFFIDDPSYEQILTLSVKTILPAVNIAWIW